MRIRITQTPVGVIDGVRVDLLRPDVTYDLPSSLACALIVEGWAEPTPDLPPTQQRFSQRLVAEAADRQRRQR